MRNSYVTFALCASVAIGVAAPCVSMRLDAPVWVTALLTIPLAALLVRGGQRIWRKLAAYFWLPGAAVALLVSACVHNECNGDGTGADMGDAGADSGGQDSAAPAACTTAEDCTDLLSYEASLTCKAVYCVPGSAPTPPSAISGCVIGPAPAGVECDNGVCQGVCGDYTGACGSPCNVTPGTPGEVPAPCKSAAECGGLHPGPCGVVACDASGNVGAPYVPHVPAGCYVIANPACTCGAVCASDLDCGTCVPAMHCLSGKCSP